ncbi:MAG: hypothetical protein E6G42_02405 [Actinobacteria bacterium]|nr:MAG: hypothetical protein E6G42_02405 [Actinomycetota bacterium]
MRLFRRKKNRLRQIGESEAYGRAYGDRTTQVKVVKLEPRRPRYQLKVSGETLRRAFAERLAKRQEADGEK